MTRDCCAMWHTRLPNARILFLKSHLMMLIYLCIFFLVHHRIIFCCCCWCSCWLYSIIVVAVDARADCFRVVAHASFIAHCMIAVAVNAVIIALAINAAIIALAADAWGDFAALISSCCSSCRGCTLMLASSHYYSCRSCSFVFFAADGPYR